MRDLVLIALAWSMLTPTLALAGAVGAKNSELRRVSGSGSRTRGAASAMPPSVAPAGSKAGTADAPGGAGRNFWLIAPTGARGGALSVLLAGDSDAEGTVSATREGFEKKFQVSAGRATSVEVPAASEDGSKGEGNVALHVTATSPVSAVVLSRGEGGTLAYAGLPSDALGTEYIAVGRAASEGAGRSRLFVLAATDSTTVTINPSVTADGHHAGDSYNVKLDKGAIYQLAEDPQAGGDLMGTVVSSDKPVAAFVEYEDERVTPDGGRGAGRLAQLPPTEAWGVSFVASPSGEYGARVRVVAKDDDTHVRVDGAEVATIDRGRFYEQAVGSHGLVTSDKPVLVALRDNEFDPSGQSTTTAPFVLVTPVECYAKTYTFATPSEGFDRQRLNVVVAGGASAGLTIDGAPVSPTAYASVGEGRFYVATLDVGGGAHRLAGTIPFGVTAYGSGAQSRYAYSFGATLTATNVRGKEGVAQSTLNAAVQPTTNAATDCGDLVSVVRHAPTINGRVEGSLQMLTGEYVNLNSGNVITSDLLVPGTPSIQINGTPNYQGTIDGTGSATPTGYAVTINSGAQVRHVVRRTNPVTLASVPVPPASAGTRSVTINYAGQGAGTWSTVRDLTLNSGVGAVTVPAGTYNNFTANDGSYLVFGVAGATTPSVYNFDTLTLNSNSGLRLVGPVQINVGSRVNVSSGAVAGYDQNPRWMELNVARYDVTVNSLGALYGVVRAPSGTVNVNGRLRGSVQSDRLSVNGGASLEWMGCAAPANQAPTVSAGSNQTVTLPNTATLNGTASDDGLPAGGSLTVTWSKVSGPGSVAFANANAATTNASFTTAGTYVLRLTASDTQLTSTSDVTVTVNPQNQAPTANAGPDVAVAMPNAATLAGTATDDGLPAGSTLTSTWSTVSGPGAVTFANSHAASTTATFAANGTYVLRLTASDTQLSASDDVTVTVDPRNAAPTVNAGADQSIELPNTASLGGVVTDDGYPRGSTLTYSWSKAAGPVAVIFANANALATAVSFNAPGTYTLRLTASDTEFTVSDDVVVIVYPQNQPPAANAGADKTVSIATGTTLDGVVTDDGYPHGSTLTSAWSKVSGPGDVTFADAAQASTSVSFGAPGVYTLRLTANDTRLTTSDDVVVNVLPVNQPPTVNAGPDAAASLGANLLRNAAAEDALVDGRIPFWTSDDGLTWAQGSHGSFGLPFSLEGETYFYPNALLDSELRQDVDVSALAPLVDAGAQGFEFKGYVRSTGGMPADGSRVVVEYRDASGAVLSSFDSGVVTSASAWAEVSDARVAPALTRVVRVRLLSVKANAQAGGGLFDHLSLRATGAAAVQLNGAAGDDGNPSGSTLAVAWGKVSGPGEVRFANSSQPSTAATFDAPGSYVLRLTANDSEFTRTDDVTVNVSLSNLPPMVNAGADAGAIVSQPLSLEGNANDDGLPSGSTLTHTWSKASGPGSVAFADSSSLSTTATFDQPGDYVLRLAASDSEYTIADELRVTVEPANTAPVVNAGADQTVNLPNAVTLGGSVSDDGLPHGASLVVTWSKVSGPGSVTFADARAASTSASFSAAGTYVLKLSASDSALTGEDEVQVTVVGVNQPPAVNAGAPQTITLPANGVSLNGSVTDDGLPVGSNLGARWSVAGTKAVPAPDSFGDDFNDNSFDTTKWRVEFVTNGATLSETNGRLQLDPYSYIFSYSNASVRPAANYLELRDHDITFKYGGHNSSGSPFSSFVVRDDGSTATLTAGISNNSIQFSGDFYLDGFNRGDGTYLYDGSPIWIRWHEQGNSYAWETSADGVNWVTRASGAFPRPPTPFQFFRVNLGAPPGHPPVYVDDIRVTSPAWDAVAGPGTVTFADASSPATSATFGGAGVYTLRLTASDTELTSSSDVTVTVNPANRPPTVDAGLAQTVLLSQAAKLYGSVSDEGLPVGGAVTAHWDKVSGPGGVTFADASSTITTATFTSAGYYTLRLTASDTELTASADVIVKVVESYAGLPGGVFVTGHDADDHSLGIGQPAIGAQHVIQRAVAYVTYDKPNPRLLFVTDLRDPGGDEADTRQGLHVAGFHNFDVADYGSGQQGALDLHAVNFSNYDAVVVASDYGGWLRQEELDILNARSAELLAYVNSGGGIVAFAESGGRAVPPGNYPGASHDRFGFIPFVVSSEEFHEAETGIRVTPEGAALGLVDTDVNGNFSHNVFTTTGGMTIVDRDAEGQILSLAVRGRYVTRDGFGNDAPVVVARSARPAVTLPNALALGGVASDDGLPEGSALTTLWRKISGPDSVTFDDPASVVTNVTFGAAGTYVLRLSASDGQLSSYADVTVTVNPAGRPVVVDAGADQTLRLPKTAALQAAVTDGRVSGEPPLTFQWSKVSGPGDVSFASPNALSTAAVFASPGVYVLRFSAGDSAYTGSDDLTVTVKPQAAPLFDDFDDNTPDTSKWFYGPGISEREGRLQVDVPDSASFPEFISQGSIDMTGDGAFVQMEIADYGDPNASGNRSIFWRIQASENHWFQWFYHGGGYDLYLDRQFLGRFGGQPRFWRLTHYADHDRVNFDVSNDASNWSNIYSLVGPYSFTLDSLTFRLIPGALGGGASGTIKFDNVNSNTPQVLPNRPPTPVTGGPYRATVGVPLQLDGGGSTDPGDVIVDYAWEFGDGSTASGATPVHTYNSVGTYTARLTVRDLDGATGSTTTTVTVAPPNLAPTVNAGANQSVRLPSSANLTGSVSDDGLPEGAAITSQWSLVSGPGLVAFANASSLNTAASFSTDGTYVLRLTASDSELSASDDVTVTVAPAPPNQPPVVSAGEDQTATPGLNLVRNGGGEEPVVEGVIPGWTKAEGESWAQAPAGTANFYESFEGATYFHAPGDAHAELLQDVDVSAYAGSIGAGAQRFAFSVAVRAASETPADTARVIFEFRDASNTNMLASADSGEIATSEAWQTVEGDAPAPAGTAFVRVRLMASRNAGETTDAYFDAVSLRALTYAGTKLAGAVTDDGLPAGSTTATWSVVSGPGQVMFADEHAAATAASFAAPGEYVLRLTASDTAATVADDVIVNVTESNHAPSADAGADQIITLPNSTTALVGAISDDGLPRGRSVSARWRKIAGPGAVTFADASSASTEASFSEAGVYVLRLTADDSDMNAQDDMVVTVKRAPVNQAPLVEAGFDQSVSLPGHATLTGQAVDDGLPTGSTVTYTWSKASGPGSVVFSAPNSLTTTASFPTEGVYVLRLTASDSALSTSDELTVNVSPQGTNSAPNVSAGPDQEVRRPDAVTLYGNATDDGLPSNSALTSSWGKVSGPGAVIFSNPNAAHTAATFDAAGTYVLRLTASDTELTSSDDVTVTVYDEATGDAPAVEILSPVDGAEVTAPTDVIGTVSGGAWRLEYAYVEDETAPARGWRTFAAGSGSVAAGALGRFDPTILLNGTYSIRLSSTDTAGRTTSDSVAVVVARQMKVGNFTISFNDLSVPVAGIPIQVTRTYDSRDKRVGDFGVGWTLSVASARVQKTVPVGSHWYETRSFASYSTYCLESTRPQIVTVTFGDGQVYKFKAEPAQRCQRFQPFSTVQMVYTPMPGTRGKLTPLNGGSVIVAGSVPGPVDIVDVNDASGYYLNPSRFRLTTRDGASFVLDQKSGVESISLPSGESLTITSDGITHSSGESVSFMRDAQGRIQEIKDPAGRSRLYTYDPNGDLATYEDAEGNTTTFTYAAGHYLTGMEVRSADGTSVYKPITNEYVDGRLVRQLDADLKEIRYEHDTSSRREVITDRLGYPTVYEYDEWGNVVYVKDAEGGETRRTYDERDNVLTVTTAEGTTVNVYDPATDDLLQTTDPYGNVTKYNYNSMKRVTSVTDPLEHVTRSEYDEQSGNLLKTTDAEGNQTFYQYKTLSSNVETITVVPKEDPSHPRVTSYRYYNNGLLLSETDPENGRTEYTYDANENRDSVTVTRTKSDGTTERIVTRFKYDNENRLVKTIYPDQTFVSVEYNQLGEQTKVTDNLHRETLYEYDSQGRLLRTIYPDRKKEENGYDEGGRRTSFTDRDERTTVYRYDKVGRLAETVYPDGGRTTTKYDALGRALVQSRWVDETTAYTTTYRYESEGRRRVVYATDALNHTTKQVFDEMGRLWKITDAKNHTTAYEYDKNNRRTRVIYPDTTSDVTEYDGFGQVVAKTDQAQRTTRFRYDRAGRLVKVIDAAEKETTYGYDELGNQTSQTDANNHTTTYEYDSLGRRTKRTLPEGMFELYAYNDAGLVESRTDFNGKTIAYRYDELNRLVRKTPDASFGAAPVTYTYTPTGRRETMTDATGTTTYDYDSRDRLKTKATPFGTLTYTYDKLGDLKTVRSSNQNGVSVDYDYDALSRLHTVTDNRLAGNNVTTYSYDDAGNLEGYTYGNGVKSLYNYNSLNRLTDLTVSRSGSTISSYAYRLGATGNREGVTEADGRAVSYTYDALYRLKNETVTGDPQAVNGGVDYRYDDVGNRLARTSTLAGINSQSLNYDKNDRPAGDSYDPNGNTKQSNGVGYTYDWENRLTAVGGVASYEYDGDGNRVSKTVGGVTSTYLVDTDSLTGYAQVVEELQGGQVVRQYTYGSDLISERQMTGNQWAVSYYCYDGHGSVRALTDSSGSVTDTYAYDAFGNLIERTGSTPNEYLYAGERLDSETGMYYLRARYMNPYAGRFLTVDAYEGGRPDPASLHKYLYANDDPANMLDPSGNMSIGELLITVAVITVVVSMSSCQKKRIPTPRNVRFEWQLTDEQWAKPAKPLVITESDKAVIKQAAYDSFMEAFAGFQVNITEGEYTNLIQVRYAYVQDDPDTTGATFPINPKLSSVFMAAAMTNAESRAHGRNITDKNDIFTGVGRGLGRSAAHELWHQLRFEGGGPQRHSSNPEEYTWGKIEGQSPDPIPWQLYFGQQRWPAQELEFLRTMIPARQ